MQVNYDFSVTATSGPLVGVTAVGTFAFDSSIIPLGGGFLPQLNLLSDLNFTWHGITYDETTANTGFLNFDAAGNLIGVAFGTIPNAGGVAVHGGEEGWLVVSSGGSKYFQYAFSGQDTFIGGGTFSVKRVGPVPVDFDGDRKTDIAVYRASTGVWWVTPSSGAPAYGYGWGGPGFKPVPGDYDGDGKTDIAIYNNTGGAWWVIPSSGTGPQGQMGAYGIGWGGSVFKSVPGDYDGDGKTDIAIYDTTGGAWWVIPSSGIPAYGVGWGGSAFKPVPGDYDGDGKTDIAIYDTVSGGWWIIPSSGTGPQGQVGAYGVGWGGSAFKPVPGDYDGDGKIDIAIYNTSTGAWWIIPSSGLGPQGQVGAYGVGWGGPGFTPVPGDYDGDKKTDVAIYQSSNGGWWIIYSSDGSTYGMGWGGDASDIPLTTNPD